MTDKDRERKREYIKNYYYIKQVIESFNYFY